jgi:GT2 family glycosyltransferase
MVTLSIIIVSFNTKKLTLECLESIAMHTKKVDYEVIVVDNNSTDASVSELKKLRSTMPLSIIENKENKGFGSANNRGIKNAKGKYILLLNSDTLLTSDVLSEMVSVMDQNPKVGVSSCALRNADGSMQGTGGFFPTLPKVFSWMFFLEDIPYLDQIIKPFHPAHGQSFFFDGMSQFSTTREQDWVTGAFMLIRHEVLDQVGVFDEDYFMYTEEVDLCFRIKKAGWKVYYVADKSIVHLGSASSTKEFPLIQEYKSMKIFYKKHMPEWQFPFLRLFLKSGAFLRMVLYRYLKGKEVSQIYAKAYQIA